VLLNLLDNASKFTPDGGKLRVEAVRDGDWCQISVIDNGIGIQKEDRERIFEPFSRLDNPLGRQRGGTGLGLTLVKQIVEKYGGKIWVDSVYGQGSRFTFTLPFVAGVKLNPEKKNDE
jgi:signal transduction histidine kinase